MCAAVTRVAPLLLAFGARAASSSARAFSRAARPPHIASRALRSEPAFAARAQLPSPRARATRHVMAQATQKEAMPAKDDQGSTLVTKEMESELQRSRAKEASFKLTPVDAKILQRMLDGLHISSANDLRKFVTKRSLPVLGLSLLETLLNGVGCFAALSLFQLLPWDAMILVGSGWNPTLATVAMAAGQAASAIAAGIMGANCIFSATTFFATLYASLTFDINAKAFLEAVHRTSGGVGIGLPHAAGKAAASIKAVNELQALHDMLEAKSLQRAERAGTRTSLALHLSALADSGGARSLGLAALALAPEEAATLSRLFSRYDADGDDQLDPQELKALMHELHGEPKQEVSDDALRAAFSILDADGDGRVSLDEFAAWYATSRLWKHGEVVAAK